MEELRSKHRKEQKDLQSRITQKKKSATKKTRKGVNDDCERLERDLAESQQREIDALNSADATANLAGSDAVDGGLTVSSEPQNDRSNEDADDDEKPMLVPMASNVVASSTGTSTQPKKPNRQKARLARRAAEQEAQVAAAEAEAASMPDLREQEMTSMKSQMDKLGLREIFVRPDGHCLYSACALGIPAEQVKRSGSFPEGYKNVRLATANFISQHPDDFSAFIEEPLETYVRKIRDTAEWGGQLELQAIARSFKLNINVLQADGRVEEIQADEPQTPSTNIWLAYYRHSFGLGEHYNALQKIKT